MGDSSPHIVVTIEGKKYDLDLSDVTGIEAKAFRQAVGVQLLEAASSDDIDPLELAAGIKWLIESRENPDLSFREVLGSITYGNLEAIADELEEEPKDPPA